MFPAATIIPRASATFAAHSRHSSTCFATLSASSAGSAPSSHAWMVPSSRCCMCTSCNAPALLERFICVHQSPPRSRQRRSNGSDRELECARDLGVVESFFPHQQRLTVALHEHVERFPRQRRFLCSLDRQRFRLDHFIDLRLFAEQLEPSSTPCVLSCFVSHEIRRPGKE